MVVDSASTQGAMQVAPWYNLRSRVNRILSSRANHISKQGIAREQGVAKEVLSSFSFSVSATSGSGGLLCSRMSRRGVRNFQDKDDQRHGRDGGKPYRSDNFRSTSGSLGTSATSISSHPAAIGSQAEAGQRWARLSKRLSPRRSPERRVVRSSPRRTLSTPPPRRIVHAPHATQQRERSSGTWVQPSWTRPPTRPPTRAEDAKLKKKTKTTMKMKAKSKTKSKMKMPLGRQEMPFGKKEAFRAAKTKCVRCRQKGHFVRDCPGQQRPQTKFPMQDRRPPEMGTFPQEGPLRPMAPYPPQDVPFNQSGIGPQLGMMGSFPMPHFTGFGMSSIMPPMLSPMMSPWFPTTPSMGFGTPISMFQPTMPHPSSFGMTTPMMFNGKIGPRPSFRGFPPMG